MLQRPRISPHNIPLNAFSILKQEERRHSAHAQIRRRVGQVVDVDLVELDRGVLGGELGDLRGDGLARAAPGGEAVDDDGVFGVDDFFFKFGVAVSLSVGVLV